MNALNLSTDARFEAAASSIEGATNLGTLRDAILAFLKPYGLRHAVYHALRIPSAGIEQDVVLFTYTKEWVRHYLSRRYYSIDPVVQIGMRSILPVDWVHIDRTLPQVRTLFGEAQDAGVGRHGLTIPVRGPAGDEAIFTVTSDMSDRDWSGSKRVICRDMQIMAHFVHSRMVQMHAFSAQNSEIILSSREKETMKWAACGKTIDATSIIMGLSKSTVRVYLDSARHKLDCLTKPQAVAKALRLGLISG